MPVVRQPEESWTCVSIIATCRPCHACAQAILFKNCHPERREGSASCSQLQIPHSVRDDKNLRSWSIRPAADKNSAPRLPAPASEIAAILQTPLPDQISSHAPRLPGCARATTSIPPAPP